MIFPNTSCISEFSISIPQRSKSQWIFLSTTIFSDCPTRAFDSLWNGTLTSSIILFLALYWIKRVSPFSELIAHSVHVYHWIPPSRKFIPSVLLSFQPPSPGIFYTQSCSSLPPFLTNFDALRRPVAPFAVLSHSCTFGCELGLYCNYKAGVSSEKSAGEFFGWSHPSSTVVISPCFRSFLYIREVRSFVQLEELLQLSHRIRRLSR